MQIPFTSASSSFGPLALYIAPYLAQARDQGFAIRSLYEQVHVLKACDRWMKRTGRDVRDLNESVLRDCLRLVSRRGYGKNAGASTLRRLLEMLRSWETPLRPRPSR